MARQIIVFALVLIAIVGLASAAETPAHAPTTSSPAGEAAGSDEVIGNTDESPAPGGNDDVVEGPVGSEDAMGPSAFGPSPGAASALQVSTFAGVVAATAAAGFFF